MQNEGTGNITKTFNQPVNHLNVTRQGTLVQVSGLIPLPIVLSMSTSAEPLLTFVAQCCQLADLVLVKS